MNRRVIQACTLAAGLGTGSLAVGAQEPDDTRLRGVDKGRIELSTAASFSLSSSPDDDDSSTTLSVPLRVGFFVARRAELEGELLFNHFSEGAESSTGVRGTGRVLYHFANDSSATPFVFAGAGVGNGLEFAGTVFDSDRTVRHFELGAGIKAFVSSSAALRLEYRFARFSWSDDGDTWGFGVRAGHINTHRVFAGVSLFVR